jgi:small-conductance mechanosensitive channel
MSEIKEMCYNPNCFLCRKEAGKDAAGIPESRLCHQHALIGITRLQAELKLAKLDSVRLVEQERMYEEVKVELTAALEAKEKAITSTDNIAVLCSKHINTIKEQTDRAEKAEKEVENLKRCVKEIITTAEEYRESIRIKTSGLEAPNSAAGKLDKLIALHGRADGIKKGDREI